jgi:hypothetical protein
MDSIIGAAHLTGGWPLVAETQSLLKARVEAERLELERLPSRRTTIPGVSGAVRRRLPRTAALLAEDAPALQAWQAASARLAPRVHNDLYRVERVARRIARRRLDRSAAEIKREARRYLVGFDDVIFEADDLEFPETTALAPSDDVEELRGRLKTLAAATEEYEAEKLFAALAQLIASLISPILAITTGIAAIRDTVEQGVRLAALRVQLAADHPVLHRVEPPEEGESELSNDELVAALTAAFAQTWNAQRALRLHLDALVWASTDVAAPSGPAAALGERLKDRGMGGGLAGIFDPAFGPWAFQQVVEEAVTDLAGPGPSNLRQATRDVYRAVDPSLAASFAETGAIMGGLLVLHIAAPPLAVVADVVLAAKGILEVITAFLRDLDAYLCTLDPADSLGLEPSVLRAALQCAGEIAGVLPGGKIVTPFSILAPLSAGFVP